MIGDGRPLYSRRWLLRRVRLENRLARAFRWAADFFSRDANRLVDHAVSEYNKTAAPEETHT